MSGIPRPRDVSLAETAVIVNLLALLPEHVRPMQLNAERAMNLVHELDPLRERWVKVQT